ncbi:MAG: bifunctional diguanylate cyclase/phosphodiesterase [Thiomicrospira sp.]
MLTSHPYCEHNAIDQSMAHLIAQLATNRLGVELANIFQHRQLKALFQPIVDLKNQRILGHEALIRGPANSSLHNPINLFQVAQEHGCLFEMDWLARHIAIESFRQQNTQDLLFINVTVNALLAEGHQDGMTLDCLHKQGIALDKVVIEITELQPVEDFNVFIESVNHYRRMGFKVALDDLDGGYNGLRMWSEVRPDFVKIDKHFILGIAQDKDKRHFLETIKTLAQGLNTKLVAEGVENEADLQVIEAIGIDYVQGYLFRRPHAQISDHLDYAWRQPSQQVLTDVTTDLSSLILETDSLDPLTPVHWVTQKLLQEHTLDFMPVVENEKVLGMIWRRELMDRLAHRFGHELHQRKPIVQIMDDQPIVVDIHTPVETLSRLITDHQASHRGDAFIITDNGRYRGCGRFLDLLRLITDLKIKNAQYANPLSGLPGNVPIQRHIEKLIQQRTGFYVIYVDADHFKPYNDFYSYDQGDEIIRMISDLLKSVRHQECDFVGHIGGDDFMMISEKANDYADVCETIIKRFNQQILPYYKEEDIQRGGIQGVNREGVAQLFPLMSLSLGVLVVPPGLVAHQQKLASLATKAKKLAKQAGGNTWAVVDAACESL